MPDNESAIAVSVCFAVSIDGNDLGYFNGCQGLGCEVVCEERQEGGNNDFVWQLPSRVKYSNVTLTRPLGPDTAKVAKWFTGMTGRVEPRTATISALDPQGKPIVSWGLIGVVPIRWSGPTLNLDSAQVATETIEIAHHGILMQGSES
jgi:phage tail-like protein